MRADIRIKTNPARRGFFIPEFDLLSIGALGIETFVHDVFLARARPVVHLNCGPNEKSLAM